MIVSNGVITRDIAEKQLPEYKARGYEAVEKTASKPVKAKKGDK